MTKHLVTVETSAGNLVLELDGDAAPVTVENFLKHVRANYFAGTVFHRVIPGFVAQAGGYEKDRRRKPPLGAPIPLESSPLKHTDGALGMARLPDPDTATSEWYLTDGAQRELDRQYCVFGRLIAGEDALKRILASPTRSDDWPQDPPVILRAYDGKPDPKNPTPVFAVTGSGPAGATDDVRKAARKLRGRAALLKARRPLLALGDVEAAIARADRTGEQSDLETAQKMLEAKEPK